MAELASDDPLARYVKDVRSPLSRLLGQAPLALKAIEGFEGASGRFRGTPLAVRALSGDDQERATAEAAKHLVATCGFERADLYTEIGEGLFTYEVKVQLLARALYVPGPSPVPFAASAEELRRLLEPDEVAELFERFLDWQEERSPLRRARSWEEVESFLEALGKGWTAPTSLSSYDAASLRFMLRELAVRWVKLTKPPSSDTLPPNDSAGSSTTPEP